VNDEIVHGIPNEAIKVINQGDIVSIDLSVWYKGLVTDAAITVPCGEVSDEVKLLLKATQEALRRGIEAAKPGNRVGDIGSAISASVAKTPFSLADDLAGHGVGYEIHEDPYVPNYGVPGRGETLVPGLVIAIEPMVNVGEAGIKQMSDGYTIKTRDGSVSAHFEHTVAITPKGNIILTL
jgi:methionyl aminopeptidase